LHASPTLVAGVAIDLGDVPFSLLYCPKCNFQWKHPPIAQEKLIACYAAADADKWELNPDPRQRRFDLLRSTLERLAAGRRVLDVGCSNGAFLQYLGDEWEKFGIEPSRSAAGVARQRGVTVVAADASELGTSNQKFDAILAIDVVEHLVDPLPFFGAIHSRLTPRGILIVFTGDTHSLAWRMQGSAYWYCSLPEHVSFYSRSTMQTIGRTLGMHEIEYQRLSHKRLPLRDWVSHATKSAVYVAGRSVRGFGVPALKRWFVDRRGPTVPASRDHFLYVLRNS
jgi:SAM-dependent methyltransferase